MRSFTFDETDIYFDTTEHFFTGLPYDVATTVQHYLDTLWLCIGERLSTGVIVNTSFMKQLGVIYNATFDIKEMGLFGCQPLCDLVLKPDNAPCPPDCNVPAILLPEDVENPCEFDHTCDPFIPHYIVTIGPQDTPGACFISEPIPNEYLSLVPHPYLELDPPSNKGPVVDQFVALVKMLLPQTGCYCFNTTGL